jgi:hypothetical protein
MRACNLQLRYLFSSLVLVAFAGLSVAQNQSSSASGASQGSGSQNSSSQNSPSQNSSPRGSSGQNSSSQSSSSQSSSGQASSSQASSGQSSSDTGNSLAAAAKSTKDQKPAAHAKKVFTDEDMEVEAGPLPSLRTDGLDNTDEVIAAITKYKTSHSPEQTEEAIHMWFDRYDQIMAAALQENLDTATIRSTNMSNAYALCQESQGNQDVGDYQKCASRQMAEQRGAQSDQHVYAKNNNLVMRIQQSFMKTRNWLVMNRMNYAWFKIRTTNNGYYY